MVHEAIVAGQGAGGKSGRREVVWGANWMGIAQHCCGGMAVA